MTSNLSKLIPVSKELEKISPNKVNHASLLEIVDLIMPDLKKLLPIKRSGFFYETLFYARLYDELTTLSPEKAFDILEAMWKKYAHNFQRFRKTVFSNGKHRHAMPDEGAVSRFFKKLALSPNFEEINNVMLWAQFLYVQKQGWLAEDLTLIADYVEEACKKDKNDSECFGSKTGKTHHKTLTFSIISGKLHIIIATYKIHKKQAILPMFEAIIAKVKTTRIELKYALLDRGFYRKEILPILKQLGITTIMPARNCHDSRKKIHLWLQDKSGRTGKLTLKLRYVKKFGWKNLVMGVVIEGKRGHTLDQVKRDFKHGTLTESAASKQVFPLLVIKGNKHGVQMLRGNEQYIRSLYRERWAIEIAFRQTHLLGIANWLQQRDKRLFRFACKCLLYNLWQIERMIIEEQTPGSKPLTLDEFCGRCRINRTNVTMSPVEV
jgi:hypothetical protein